MNIIKFAETFRLRDCIHDVKVKMAERGKLRKYKYTVSVTQNLELFM